MSVYLSGSILDDTYDERDVEYVKTNDGFMRSVLGSFRCKNDVAKGVDMLNDILLFRARMKLNGMQKIKIINAKIVSHSTTLIQLSNQIAMHASK